MVFKIINTKIYNFIIYNLQLNNNIKDLYIIVAFKFNHFINPKLYEPQVIRTSRGLSPYLTTANDKPISTIFHKTNYFG